MRLHGWCEGCHRERLVTMHSAPTKGIPVGLCAACLAKRDTGRHELTVYVPHPASPLRRVIKPGSAIVGSPTGERITIDYEGDVYGSGHDFDHMLFHAAGRHVEHYPTVARSWVRPEDLIPVGTYELDGLYNGSLDITDQGALDEWRQSCLTK